MSNLPVLVQDGALATGVAALLYAGTITVTALTALLAPSAARRCDARKVLTILLRRQDGEPAAAPPPAGHLSTSAPGDGQYHR